MQLNGQNESYALLPLYAAPPPVPAFLGLGMHALTFAGEVYLESTHDAVKQLKENLDDADDVFTWDLDITVGPPWREVRTVAPLVVITDVYSNGTHWMISSSRASGSGTPNGQWKGFLVRRRSYCTFRLNKPERSSKFCVSAIPSPPPGICAILTLLSRSVNVLSGSPGFHERPGFLRSAITRTPDSALAEAATVFAVVASERWFFRYGQMSALGH